MKNSISDFLISAEVQTFLENNILKPLLDKVFSYLYPYLLGIMSLWIIMFLCTIMILVLLLKTGFPV
jgi:hypothetical protein